jgi:flavin reductase (DIM6/NTAB) family NADH-FMN oxidoreductase RutF
MLIIYIALWEDIMDKVLASSSSALQPRPAILLSCRGLDGRNNALAIVYACNCSYDPPMIMAGIVPSRFSYKLVKESGCFVINLVPEAMKDVFTFLGSKSGRDGDKLTEAGVALSEAVTIKAPLLADCPVNIECRVVDSVKTGSHEMFIGKVEYVHADRDLVGADGKIDWTKIDFLRG